MVAVTAGGLSPIVTGLVHRAELMQLHGGGPTHWKRLGGPASVSRAR